MPAELSLREVLHNHLREQDLPFRDFVRLALYHPELGYYTRPENPVGRHGDYITAPTLSPAFAFAIGRLVREFVSRAEGEVCSIVDIGCGDGSLIRAVAAAFRPPARFLGSSVPRFLGDGEVEGTGGAGGMEAPPESPRGTPRNPEEPRNPGTEELRDRGTEGLRFFGIDQSLHRANPQPDDTVEFATSLDAVPTGGAHLLFTNELFDAFPFARLVRRGSSLHELWVTKSGDTLDWSEREAPQEYARYFDERGVALDDGQFADISLDWSRSYEDLARRVEHGLIVTCDYGFQQSKLFHPRARRYGTAAAYTGQRVTRDLLAQPGEQDLTAHINFTDLERAGERRGARTLFFDSLARFLLGLGITEHEHYRPIEEFGISTVQEGVEAIEARENARRLVLPDGIGHDLRVLVQVRGFEGDGWSFQRPLF
ncbi:MAG: SAM-dependent methyltransferase [Thermoanaerobaculia bacterium]